MPQHGTGYVNVDEDKTPRETGRWDVWATGSKELSKSLESVEIAGKNLLSSSRSRQRGRRAKYLRYLANEFVMAFERWDREDVPYEEKSEDKNEFVAFHALVRKFFEGRSGKRIE